MSFTKKSQPEEMYQINYKYDKNSCNKLVRSGMNAVKFTWTSQ